MSVLLVKLAVRLVVFGAVFGFAAKKHPKIEIQPKYALPLIALVFALLNTAVYWIAKPVLNLATLGAAWLFLPLVLNAAFLWGTQKLLRPLRIEGVMAMGYLALLLTAAHGVLWVLLDLMIF